MTQYSITVKEVQKSVYQISSSYTHGVTLWTKKTSIKDYKGILLKSIVFFMQRTSTQCEGNNFLIKKGRVTVLMLRTSTQ